MKRELELLQKELELTKKLLENEKEYSEQLRTILKDLTNGIRGNK